MCWIMKWKKVWSEKQGKLCKTPVTKLFRWGGGLGKPDSPPSFFGGKFTIWLGEGGSATHFVLKNSYLLKKLEIYKWVWGSSRKKIFLGWTNHCIRTIRYIGIKFWGRFWNEEFELNSGKWVVWAAMGTKRIILGKALGKKSWVTIILGKAH